MKSYLLAISLLWILYYARGKSLEIFGVKATARKLIVLRACACNLRSWAIVAVSLLRNELLLLCG